MKMKMIARSIALLAFAAVAGQASAAGFQLLEQNASGIGNAYSDEILHRAQLTPVPAQTGRHGPGCRVVLTVRVHTSVSPTQSGAALASIGASG